MQNKCLYNTTIIIHYFGTFVAIGGLVIGNVLPILNNGGLNNIYLLKYKFF